MQPTPVPDASLPYYKVLVTGDRHWSDYDSILEAIKRIASEVAPRQVFIVHGKAMGADSLASKAADALRIAQHGYPADWEHKHRAAGPIRNQLMIDENPDIELCLVVHDNLAASKGTRDCMRRAERAGIPLRFLNHTQEGEGDGYHARP